MTPNAERVLQLIRMSAGPVTVRELCQAADELEMETQKIVSAVGELNTLGQIRRVLRPEFHSAKDRKAWEPA